jgi:hypothetical protein
MLQRSGSAHPVLEERLDVGGAKAAVAARCGEGSQQAGPLPVDDRPVGDPQQPRDVAGRVPVGFAVHRAVVPTGEIRQSPENRKKQPGRNRRSWDFSS